MTIFTVDTLYQVMTCLTTTFVIQYFLQKLHRKKIKALREQATQDMFDKVVRTMISIRGNEIESFIRWYYRNNFTHIEDDEYLNTITFDRYTLKELIKEYLVETTEISLNK